MCMTLAEPSHHISGINEPDWLELGTLSCFPPEVLCGILSFLPIKDFNALLCTAKAFNNNNLVRETYLKSAVEELSYRYFGDLKDNPKEQESKRRHFSRHMDTAINRLKQVIPAKDIGLIETTLRREPLYTASLLRRCSNDGRLTYKVKSLNDRPDNIQGQLINLPGTSKLFSVGLDWGLEPESGSLRVWDATFAADHLPKHEPLCDVRGGFPRVWKCDVFPNGRVAMLDCDEIIHIFAFNQCSRPELITRIQPPEDHQNFYHELYVISNDIIITGSDDSLWLFDLRRPVGYELFRKLEHHDHGFTHFAGLLATGELVSFGCCRCCQGTIKIWQALKSSVGEVNACQREEHIKEVNTETDGCSYKPITPGHGGKIVLWQVGAPIKICDVRHSTAERRIVSSISPPTDLTPVNTPNGQLLAISVSLDSRRDTLRVWQLTDSPPVLVRQVNLGEVLNYTTTLNPIPDGRVLMISDNNMGVIDLTRAECIKVIKSVKTSESSHPPLWKKVTMVSGELSVFAYSFKARSSSQLLDYYAV